MIKDWKKNQVLILKPLILIVEDNNDILLNIKLTLEFNGFEVITATNGKEGLKVLSEQKNLPEIIVSDIMMPEMDGYDFFQAVSNNPRWSSIPFLFLTARSTPEDIRFGKMLGVDDYLTKPFKEADLLATISGKLARKKRADSYNEKIIDMLNTFKVEVSPSISEEEKHQVVLLVVMWDDYIGPDLKQYYPEKENLPISIKELGQQLFQSAVSIYGHDDMTKAEGILLNIENIKRYGYIFFDAYIDETTRAGERQFMIGLIAPRISYFESFKIKEILREISLKIKEKDDWDVKEFWEKILNILSAPTL